MGPKHFADAPDCESGEPGWNPGGSTAFFIVPQNLLKGKRKVVGIIL